MLLVGFRILGPALFILYINDMCNVSMLIKSIVFADDTNFFYSGDNLSQVRETVSTELGKLHSWFQNKFYEFWLQTV